MEFFKYFKKKKSVLDDAYLSTSTPVPGDPNSFYVRHDYVNGKVVEFKVSSLRKLLDSYK